MFDTIDDVDKVIVELMMSPRWLILLQATLSRYERGERVPTEASFIYRMIIRM